MRGADFSTDYKMVGRTGPLRPAVPVSRGVELLIVSNALLPPLGSVFSEQLPALGREVADPAAQLASWSAVVVSGTSRWPVRWRMLYVFFHSL